MTLSCFSNTTARITCDPQPRYINVHNGMLDWASGEMLGHSPDYRSTVQLPVEYHPEAICGAFEKWLAEVLPPDCYESTCDSEGFIWEVIGYTMYSGNPLHAAVLLYGKGRNGKGTLIRVLKALLGERNCSAVGLHELTENRFRTATLYGKLANLAGDLDSRWIANTAAFKAITGGDLVQAEHKFGHPFEFTPWAFPFYSANKAFGSADSSEGWVSRWTVVPFPNTFDDDPDRGLDAVLAAPDELRGVMARGVRALPALMARGRFLQPESVIAAKTAFIEASDAVRSWVGEYCTLDFDAWTAARQVVLHLPARGPARTVRRHSAHGSSTTASSRLAGSSQRSAWVPGIRGHPAFEGGAVAGRWQCLGEEGAGSLIPAATHREKVRRPPPLCPPLLARHHEHEHRLPARCNERTHRVRGSAHDAGAGRAAENCRTLLRAELDEGHQELDRGRRVRPFARAAAALRGTQCRRTGVSRQRPGHPAPTPHAGGKTRSSSCSPSSVSGWGRPGDRYPGPRRRRAGGSRTPTPVYLAEWNQTQARAEPWSEPQFNHVERQPNPRIYELPSSESRGVPMCSAASKLRCSASPIYRAEVAGFRRNNHRPTVRHLLP